MKMSLSRIGMAALILGSCCGVQSAGAAEIGALALSDGLPAHGSFSREPAKAWEQAFFTGNGRMGAMVYGQPARQTIVANHCRLFLPLGNREIVPDLAPEVPALRRIIREQGYGAAMDFFLGKARQQGFPGIIPTDPFHPGFKLLLETGTLSGRPPPNPPRAGIAIPTEPMITSGRRTLRRVRCRSAGPTRAFGMCRRCLCRGQTMSLPYP